MLGMQPVQVPVQLQAEGGKTKRCRPLPGDNVVIGHGKGALVLPEVLPKKPLDAISDHGSTHPATDGHPETGMGTDGIRPDDDEVLRVYLLAAVRNGQKIISLSEPITFRKTT
jgi:hypothetical protein